MEYYLSMDDCNTIVRADPKISVEILKANKFETIHIPGKPGYLGQYSYLIIYYETVTKLFALGLLKQVHGTFNSRRYFMKSLPYHDLVLTKAVEKWGIFRKEAEIYCHLFNNYERSSNKVIKWAPDCFFARHNLLVMEDLTSVGYRTAEFRKTLNEQHMKLVFERLAQMHACSLHFEIMQLEGSSIGSSYNQRMLFETTFTPTSGWFVAGLKGIQKVALERNHYANDAVKKTIIQEQLWSNLERIYTLAENTDQFRSVVVHRDLWINNIMFNTILPPAVDYLSAFYLLTDNEHRTQFAEKYAEYYYNSLQQKLTMLGLNGSTILSREEFQKTLSRYRLLGLVWAGVLHGFVNFPNGVLEKLHQEDPETYTHMSMVNRDDFIMKYYDTDDFFRDRLNDIVTELLQYLFCFE